MDDELLTVEKAAKALGLSPSTIRQQIARGHLHAERMGRWLYVIRSVEVERYRAERKRDPNRQPSPSALYQRERRARLKAQQPAGPAEE
jgi:excisionase family DNA binding protein